MKRVFIIHGWEGSPEEPLHKWLKKELEARGFEVIVPEMPNPEKPEINAWVRKLKEIVKEPDENTYLIGHSIGCQTILRYLETLSENTKIKSAILIAPWFKLQGIEESEEEIAKPWIETPINLDKLKSHVNSIVCIFSTNDPYVPLSDREIFRQALKAKIIVEHERGHFTEEDNVGELPVVIDEIRELR